MPAKTKAKPKTKPVKKSKAKAGRPKGAKNAKDISRAVMSRCKKCGSTERGKYLSKRELVVNGVNEKGERYTHVIWRRCQCLNCGQFRTDVSIENRKK